MKSELAKFLEECAMTSIPSGEVARVKLLAKELALGVLAGLWKRTLDDVILESRKQYLQRRWDMKYLSNEWHVKAEQLRGYGYLEEYNTYDGGKLTNTAFDLLDETEPYNIFISYKRSESSALALLVLARLKEHGLIPFVDMALEAGGNWHAELEDRIKENDYFIILLGKDTLSSPMTLKEIQWALKYGKTIIPVWHSGFELNDDKWTAVDETVKNAIQQTNAIRVTDESASGYNTAIVELLNRFGVTP